MLFQKTVSTLALYSLFSAAGHAQIPPTQPQEATSASAKQPRHGTPATPISRQYQCYKEGGFYWPADGSGIPQSDCKAAYQLVYHKYIDKSGTVVPKKEGEKDVINSKGSVNIIEQSNYQFRQWNEVSKNIPDYNNQDAVKAAIPDGQLCSAGNAGAEWDGRGKVWNDNSGLDAVTAWRATNIKKNKDGKLDIVYDATATHDPSFFEVYISRPDYNAATAPLKWSDLVLLEKVENVKPTNQKYVFAVNADGYKGKHVIYIRWQRIDSVGEGFYSCSDVNIQE